RRGGNRLDDRSGQVAPRREMPCDSLQSRTPGGRGPEHLEKLHGGQDQLELPAQVQGANVSAYRPRRNPAGRRSRAERRDQRGVDLNRPDLIAEVRQVEGDPSRPAAELQDSAAAGGEALPDREIRGIAPALDLVPDGRRAHAQYLLASPRFASMVRSSSRAV